jgi:two-component system chemotaxis response regulator CheY
MPTPQEYEKIRLLIVEDEANTRMVIKAVLRQLGIRNVFEAANGRDGLVEVVRERPHLVLCDVHMEPVDGLEFLKTLRAMKIEAVKNTPVIFLTADSQQGTVLFAKQNAANGYLVKPPSVTSVKARIDQVWPLLKL